MTDSAEMFKRLAQSRLKSTSVQEESKTQQETRPKVKKPVQEVPKEKQSEVEIAPESIKKRGRPATGKRSDPDWIGRTYYIRKETDFDIEDELIKLKRIGINLDKSELVDFLLGAWVKWRKGDNIDFQISEIAPRRKGE